MNDRRGEAFHAILEAKYARIINQISEVHNISVEDAMGIFYNSPMLPLLEEGIADLHCRSDKYLAEEIWSDYKSVQYASTTAPSSHSVSTP